MGCIFTRKNGFEHERYPPVSMTFAEIPLLILACCKEINLSLSDNFSHSVIAEGFLLFQGLA
jgi:hypothetical protein